MEDGTLAPLSLSLSAPRNPSSLSLSQPTAAASAQCPAPPSPTKSSPQPASRPGVGDPLLLDPFSSRRQVYLELLLASPPLSSSSSATLKLCLCPRRRAPLSLACACQASVFDLLSVPAHFPFSLAVTSLPLSPP
ncbi:uncharacterized protein DS421_14g447250 [Arachis hypogaea]|nr:uncharacterized protein DS421_14g447250 [Arachis hypogaea]